MAKFEFNLSDEDLNRLFAIKQIQGKDNLTGNDFAAELLHETIISLFPYQAEFDEIGNVKNKQCYKGGKV